MSGEIDERRDGRGQTLTVIAGGVCYRRLVAAFAAGAGSRILLCGWYEADERRDGTGLVGIPEASR